MILKWYENTGLYWEKWRLIWLLFWIINRNFLKILIKFDRSLIFQGFERIFGGIVAIFGDVKSGEMLDFSMFCRTHYRTQNGGLDVETTDMPFWQSNICSKKCKHTGDTYRTNVLKYTIIVQYYCMFLSCQVKMLYTCNMPVC